MLHFIETIPLMTRMLLCLAVILIGSVLIVATKPKPKTKYPYYDADNPEDVRRAVDAVKRRK
jgi:hypothetical protein